MGFKLWDFMQQASCYSKTDIFSFSNSQKSLNSSVALEHNLKH